MVTNLRKYKIGSVVKKNINLSPPINKNQQTYN